MVQFNMKKREVSLKVVYYGPPLSGKTTNLQRVFDVADHDSRGRLVTLETRDDRTIYFDMLPMSVSASSGHRMSFKIYTVPGQPIHNATRRVVLRGVDGIVFVATSERDELRANRHSWANMLDNLVVNHLDLREVPIVLQFNKQDLPNVLGSGEIQAVEHYSRIPCKAATALTGEGVRETLETLLMMLWDQLCERKSFDDWLGLTRQQFREHIAQVFGGAPGEHGTARP